MIATNHVYGIKINLYIIKFKIKLVSVILWNIIQTCTTHTVYPIVSKSVNCVSTFIRNYTC